MKAGGPEERTIPGSPVEFDLSLASYLPLPLTSVSLEVSLAFTAAAVAASPKKDSVGDRRSGGGGKGARGVQRSPSAVSSSNNSVIRYQ